MKTKYDNKTARLAIVGDELTVTATVRLSNKQSRRQALRVLKAATILIELIDPTGGKK